MQAHDQLEYGRGWLLEKQGYEHFMVGMKSGISFCGSLDGFCVHISGFTESCNSTRSMGHYVHKR